MFARDRRYLTDSLFGLLIRSTSLVVGLLILGMFTQMLLVVWPMFAAPSVSEQVFVAGMEPGTAAVPESGGGENPGEFADRPVTIDLPRKAVQLVLVPGDSVIAVETRPQLPVTTPVRRQRLSLLEGAGALSFAAIDVAERYLLLTFKSGIFRLMSIRDDGHLESAYAGTLPAHRSVRPVPGGQSWVLVTEDALVQVHLVFLAAEASVATLRSMPVSDGIAHASTVSPDRRVLVATRSGEIRLWQLDMRKLTALDGLRGGARSVDWLSPVLFEVIYSDGSTRYFELASRLAEMSVNRLFFPVQFEGYSEPGYYWQPSATSDGFEPKTSLIPLLLGTLKAALVGLVLAVPVALGAAIFVGYYLSSRRREQVKPFIEVIASFPTVVIAGLAALWLAPRLIESLPEIVGGALALPILGVVALLMAKHLPTSVTRRGEVKVLPLHFLPGLVIVILVGAALGHWVEQWLFEGSLVTWLPEQGIAVQQLNSLLVGFILGFAILPTVFSLAEEAIYEVPRVGAAGSIALGATPWRSFQDVVLPIAAPGIISAVMLGFGRGIGETMIFLLLSGNAPGTDGSLFSGIRSLSATLAIELPEAAVGGTHFRTLFLGALILFALTFVINTLGHLIRNRILTKHRVSR